MFDLPKMNFLSSSFVCVNLVDHTYQAGDLSTFSSLSWEKKKEVTANLLQKEVVFVVEAIQNSSVVASSFA